jgi:hypothetical protein
MSTPLDDQQNRKLPEDRLLDRLVDGELRDEERRPLLQRLEVEPDGWRRCALLFLEAQAWRESLCPMTASVGALAEPAEAAVRGATPSVKKTRQVKLIANICVLAACVAIAFALGWELHPKPDGFAANVLVAKVDPGAATPAPPAVTKSDADTAVAKERLAPSRKESVPLDVLLKKWEQRGYRAERQDRVVPMELKDGRKVNVPVHEYRIQYLGGRTY